MRVFSVKTKKNKGYSLLEVLLVLVILVAVFFPLIQVLSRLMIASEESKGTNTALKLAQAKLETIKNISYDNISSEGKATVPSFPTFQRQVIIIEPSTNIKNVNVIIFWNSGEGSELSIEVESLVRNDEE